MTGEGFVPRAKLWLTGTAAEPVFGDGKMRLLEATAQAGSLRRAAERLGISYRKAWGDVRRAEEALGTRLVRRERGGQDHGGSWLTDDGARWLKAWQEYRRDVEGAVERAYTAHLAPVLGAARGEREPWDQLLLLGAEGRNAGKTVLACDLVRRFSPAHEVIAVKVTTVEDRRGPCPRGGEGCGACGSLDAPYCITEESAAPATKDTGRMRDAGAARVLWARCRAGSLGPCLEELRRRIPPSALVVAESNSLARVVEPGVFLMLREKDATAAKASAARVARFADRVVLTDGAAFDLDPADLDVRDGAWRLLDASAVILAGGSSSRMGRDKALLELHGAPAVARLASRLRGWFREVLISANDPGAYAFTGLRVVPDRVPGRGPLMGIASALEAAAGSPVLCLACDIPEVDTRFLRRLLAAGRRHDAAVPRRADGMLEPLFAAWRRGALPAVDATLAAGESRIVAAFARLDVAFVEAGDAGWLHNLNTPEDLAAWAARPRAGGEALP